MVVTGLSGRIDARESENTDHSQKKINATPAPAVATDIETPARRRIINEPAKANPPERAPRAKSLTRCGLVEVFSAQRDDAGKMPSANRETADL
jgi:hypothetical protein